VRPGGRRCEESQFGHQEASRRSRGFSPVLRLVANSPLIGNPVHNLIISIVLGPQATLYFLGCEVEAIYPLGPLFHGCGLSVTVMSLNGKVNVGIIACPDLAPDLWRLADGFDVALAACLASNPVRPFAASRRRPRQVSPIHTA
jgi:hypothetical protein